MTTVVTRQDARALLDELLYQISGRKKTFITETTTLNYDLGIGGDDAVELIEEIHRKFGTTFGGFKFESYFSNEGEAFFEHLAGIFGYKNKKRKTLPLGHMLDVIQIGAWFEAPNE